MSVFNQFQDLLGQIEARVQLLVQQESTAQKSLETVRTFDDVVSAKDQKQSIGAEVDKHSWVSARLADISVNLIRVRTLRKTISQGEIPPALVPKMQTRVDRLIKDMEDLRTAYQSLEHAYDARLRFYNSCVYHM